ncbi:MAG: dehydratase [Ardenticatenales bacterium]|nr:dehydratase [Ardenticatenales bacterium]
MPQSIDGYFEDFLDQMTFQTAGRTITEADIVNFAGVSGDFNPIHINATYAANTMFGQRIAHGLLVLSIASGLTTGLGFMGDRVEAFLGIGWKFRAPVYIGDTIHVVLQVSNLRPMRRLGGGIVTLDIQVVKQDGTPVQKGEWQVLFKSRPTSEATGEAGSET